MVFTDPPYNVPIDGHAMGSGGPESQDRKSAFIR